MAQLFASGRIVDLILAAMALEGLLIVLYRRRTGRGLELADLAANLAAGAFLMLALRSALTGGPWTWVASWLSLGLVAHLSDLARRWRR